MCSSCHTRLLDQLGVELRVFYIADVRQHFERGEFDSWGEWNEDLCMVST